MTVTDTVWWDTPGGKVTEHHVDNDISCSLMLYDDGGSITFEWTDPRRVLVTAINSDWQFPADWNVPVAMQFGDVWLSNHADSAVMDGVGHGNSVAFATDQGVDDLLRSADHIVVKTTSADMTIRLVPRKLDVLLSRTRQCRDTIRR